MRKFRVTLLALVGLLVMATPAAAKGPEKAALTGPGIEDPIVFLDQSAPPDGNQAPLDLMGMVLFNTPRSEPIDPPDDPGAAYTITWHMIDGSVITQHVYLAAHGGALIHTPGEVAAETWGLQAGWHRAPARLDDAINTLVEWGQPSVAEPTSDSALPMILVVAVAALVLWGRRLPDYGAQASINLANDATV